MFINSLKFFIGVMLLAFTASISAITWQPPVNLSIAGQNAANVQVAINSAGNAVAVWQANGYVQASTRHFGGVWSAPVNISTAGDGQFPQVAVDGAGNIVAIWLQSPPSSDLVLMSSTLLFGAASWTAPVPISVPPFQAENAQLAMNAAGNAVAVWSYYDGSAFRAQASTLNLGGSWGGSWTAPVYVSMGGQSVAIPRVAIDSSGNAAMVWVRFDVSNAIVQASTLPFGGSWTAPINLSEAGQNANNPHITVSSSGNVIAVWQRSDGINQIIQSRSLPFGGAWSAVSDLSTAGQDSTKPQVAMDSAGNAVVVWIKPYNGISVVQSSTLSVGATSWSPFINLSVEGQNADTPHVAMDNSGTVAVIWKSTGRSSSSIVVSTLPHGEDWTPHFDFFPLTTSADNPQVALNGSGTAIAAWQSSTIQASIGIATPPPEVGAGWRFLKGKWFK